MQGDLPTTRKEALERGEKHYFTGKPCKNGHVFARYAKTGRCIQCSRDKEKEVYQENKEIYKKRQKQWYYNNRGHALRQRAAYRSKNAEWKRASYRRWAKENPEKVNTLNSYKRARRNNATPSWVNQNQIRSIYGRATLLSEFTGEQYHVDHIIPLRGENVCGLHVPWNLQILLAKENLSKSNKVIDNV